MRLLNRLLIMGCCLTLPQLALGQALIQEFPEGLNGIEYEAVRVDLLGRCSFEVEVDGVLDEDVWGVAPFQTMDEYWKGGRTPCFADPNDPDCVTRENYDPQIAAVATEDWLYIAYRIMDDTRSIDSGEGGCGAHHDDSMEIYIDWHNDKAADYEEDDVQFQFWSGNIPGPKEVADEQATIDYKVGWISQGGCIGNENFNGHLNAPEEYVHRAWATDITNDDGIPIGWQAEVQIALNVEANGKAWEVDPSDGASIGIDFHGEDDDHGGSQGGGDDSAHIWSLTDAGSRAWRTPSVFGQITFRVLEDACSDCEEDPDSVVITGTDRALTGEMVTLVAEFTGADEGSAVTYDWRVVRGPATLEDNGDGTANVTCGDSTGDAVIEVSADDDACESAFPQRARFTLNCDCDEESDGVVIEGPDVSAIGEPATLTAVFSGADPGTTVSYSWVLLEGNRFTTRVTDNGDGTANVTSSSDVRSEAVIELRADDGACDNDEGAVATHELVFDDLGVGPFVRGDSNADGRVELADAVKSLGFLFLGADPPICLAAANADGAGVVERTAALFTLNRLFLGGEPFPPPTGECGTSTETVDVDLGCDDTSACP